MIGRITQFFMGATRRGRPQGTRWDLDPEDRCVVNVTDQAVVCSHPDGGRETISWPDLRRVEIEASDGPWGRNALWILSDNKHICRIPHGSVGEMSLMAALQSLPEWDNGAIMAALRSEGEFRYECWNRDEGWRRPRWGRGRTY